MERTLIEPASPFVFVDDEPYPVPEQTSAGVLGELLASPDPLIDRLSDRASLERVVLSSVLVIALSIAVFAALMMSPHGWAPAARSAILLAMNSLLSLAAALGPIYATSILLAARVPLARLSATLLAAAAHGALVLATVAPVPYFLVQVDDHWAGPLGVVGAFAIAAVAAGFRLYRLLMLLAVGTRPLNPAEHHRVAILARVALMIFSLTSALALWGFEALVVV